MKKYLLGFLRYFFYPKVSKLSLVTNDSLISTKAKVNRFSKIYSSSISHYTYIGGNSEIVNTKIGKYCSIARDCIIGLASHTINNISTCPIFTEKHNGTGFSWVDHDYVNHKSNCIEIGNDVWIGTRAIILSRKGILKIGDGAIIGAGAIVTKDVPPYSIVAGVPAKIIRYRFTPEIIEKLLEIRWWNYPEEVLKNKLSVFQMEDLGIELLEEFLKN